MKDQFIPEKLSVKETMHLMGKVAKRILFVVDSQERLLGTVTDGDIRRWVLSGGKLLDPIARVYHKNPVSLNEKYNLEKVKKMMIDRVIDAIPIVNKERKIIKVLLWNEVFGEKIRVPKVKLTAPVVIMAGGKGTRLDPFTRVLPKPLIPIGERTILEMIMEKFSFYGAKEFFISINHRSRMIKAYFEESGTSFKVNFIEESKPLGTAGSLSLLSSKMRGPIVVSNCDIIIEADYNEIIKFHQTHKNDITIVGSFRHFTIPYGICHIEDGGALIDIEEKPEYDFLANTGMYVLDAKTLALIPKNEFYNMTELIKLVKHKGGKVGVFPVDEKSWVDVGQLGEYHQVLRSLEMEI